MYQVSILCATVEGRCHHHCGVVSRVEQLKNEQGRPGRLRLALTVFGIGHCDVAESRSDHLVLAALALQPVTSSSSIPHCSSLVPPFPDIMICLIDIGIGKVRGTRSWELEVLLSDYCLRLGQTFGPRRGIRTMEESEPEVPTWLTHAHERADARWCGDSRKAGM
ncbi:hypothetical protein LSTR_LSTR003708 [Laodelphax striatellus]|uniref:Uncharacterized protein n=1 Tax=Laodelphax striatellus TaxID=195883 RepID=A0A482WZK2_LAOST|nr:hypothetical protein LSTR_LSTR003708 [Laodelphax striatellus]